MRNLFKTIKFKTSFSALVLSSAISLSAQANQAMVGGQGTAGYVSAGQSYSVSLNKTEIVRLPSAASAVIIGNPNIADVSVHASDTLFVIGRGFGVRGDRQSYSCLPNCQPAPVLGDDPEFVGNFTSSSNNSLNNSEALPAQGLSFTGIQAPSVTQGF